MPLHSLVAAQKAHGHPCNPTIARTPFTSLEVVWENLFICTRWRDTAGLAFYVNSDEATMLVVTELSPNEKKRTRPDRTQRNNRKGVVERKVFQEIPFCHHLRFCFLLPSFDFLLLT